MKIMGLVLAGGLSRRMGGQEKSLMELNGAPLIQIVAGRLMPQVDTLMINANGDGARFGFTGLQVVADTLDGFAGPLAGLLAGMRAAKDATHILTAAADTPFFPTDLAQRLAASLDSADQVAMARSGTRVHPVFGLWPVALGDALEAFLVQEDKRKILEFANRYTLHEVPFPMGAVDPFFNVNTPRDLEEARAYHGGEMV
ncbi:MAG: molybdenum cofactor guanylyltransferase MobA [Pseudomonadota bacterium]